MKSLLPPLAVATLALAAPAPAQDSRFSVSSLDRSVDPCVDFYSFACGGWRAANPIPADQTRWGRFNELAERNREDLRLILERVQPPASTRSPLEAKVGDYYAACMDEAGIEAKGREPIRPALDRVAAVDSKKAFFRLLGEHEAQALPALFRFGAAPDMHDSQRTIASLGQGGLGLPDRDDYLNEDAKSKEKRERYAGYVTRLLELAGASPDLAKRDAETILRIETALARAHLSRVEMRDPKNRDNPMSVEELGKLAPAFEWGEFLPATGAPSFARLNLSSRKYFAEGNALVESVPLEDWKTYLRWDVVRAAVPFLGNAIVEEDFNFNRAYLQGAKEGAPVAGRNSPHSKAGASFPSASTLIGLSRFFGSRISTRLRCARASPVSIRRTVSASFFARSGEAPVSSSRRVMYPAYLSRFSFDFASSFR